MTGKDGLLKNAKNAVEKYNKKSNEEVDTLKSFEEKLNEYVGTIIEDYDSTNLKVDENGLSTANIRIKPNEDNPDNMQIIIPTGFAPAILQTGKLQSLPGEDGSVKEKMPAEQWNMITVEDINKGVVLVDKEENELVWVPITTDSKFARVEWITKCGYDASGKWQENGVIHPLSEISIDNKWWENKTTSEYSNMVGSITNNKGFYVARYEASKNNNLAKAQSKRGENVWNYISQIDAITESAKCNTVLHSHLMYGIEWDSILNWLKGNAQISTKTSTTENQEIKTVEINDLQTNSGSWGNYSDSTGNAGIGIGSLQKTGKSEYWKANNIYDFAGNAIEWTQEKWSTGTVRAMRGGYYYVNAERRRSGCT